ncbi:MAG TPA: MarR family winged helix-turn-helix transcriptional regulator [Roseiflexaceae bacterium]|nr:MarR family winged helix-turn-helix transcriptional regulator [Roseiflexaceae bacterium]
MGTDSETESPPKPQFTVLLVQLYRDLVRAYERETGLSPSRMSLLHALYRDGEITQTELQHHVGVEGPVITRIVKQMEADGCITRRVSPQDNRCTLVALAPAGLELLDRARQVKAAFEARLLTGLSENEKSELLRILEHVSNNLRKQQECK